MKKPDSNQFPLTTGSIPGQAPRCSYSGFTLIELLTTIAVLAILLSIGIPSYREMIRNNCIVTYNNAMISGVQLARSEAAKRRAPVRVSALNSSDGGNEWGPGLRIWQDANSDDTFDAGESIREIELSCGQTTMDETSGITEFIYDSTGDVDTVSSVEICDDRSGEQGSQITISPIGRPSSTSITCS